MYLELRNLKVSKGNKANPVFKHRPPILLIKVILKTNTFTHQNHLHICIYIRTINTVWVEYNPFFAMYQTINIDVCVLDFMF